MYTRSVSHSGQARGFRAFASLGVGALGVGVWASLAGAGIASADNQSSRAPGAAVSATPTASAKVPKSTRPAARSAKARAVARGFVDPGATSLFDLIGGTSLLETGGGEYAQAGLNPQWKPDLSLGAAAPRDISTSMLPDSLRPPAHIDGIDKAMEYSAFPGSDIGIQVGYYS